MREIAPATVTRQGLTARKSHTLRDRLRRLVRLHELHWECEVRCFVAGQNKDPAFSRLARTSNRLVWLSRGYSPWYDGSAQHKGSQLELLGVVIKENMTPRNEALLAERFASWREEQGIKMDAESVARRQAEDLAETQRRTLSWARSLRNPPLIVRVVRWLARCGFVL